MDWHKRFLKNLNNGNKLTIHLISINFLYHIINYLFFKIVTCEYSASLICLFPVCLNLFKLNYYPEDELLKFAWNMGFFAELPFIC